MNNLNLQQTSFWTCHKWFLAISVRNFPWDYFPFRQSTKIYESKPNKYYCIMLFLTSIRKRSAFVKEMPFLKKTQSIPGDAEM